MSYHIIVIRLSRISVLQRTKPIEPRRSTFNLCISRFGRLLISILDQFFKSCVNQISHEILFILLPLGFKFPIITIINLWQDNTLCHVVTILSVVSGKLQFCFISHREIWEPVQVSVIPTKISVIGFVTVAYLLPNSRSSCWSAPAFLDKTRMYQFCLSAQKFVPLCHHMKKLFSKEHFCAYGTFGNFMPSSVFSLPPLPVKYNPQNCTSNHDLYRKKYLR